MSTLENLKSGVRKKSVVKKARWVGQFGPSQIEEKVEQTPRQGKSKIIHDKTYTIFISPVLEANGETKYPHQLMEIHHKDTMSKGQAKATIAKFLGICLADDFIIKPQLKKHNDFIQNAWKTSDLLRSDQEQKILNCIKELETENYVVIKEIMYKRLRKREGAFFTHQNRASIETIIKKS